MAAQKLETFLRQIRLGILYSYIKHNMIWSYRYIQKHRVFQTSSAMLIDRNLRVYIIWSVYLIIGTLKEAVGWGNNSTTTGRTRTHNMEEIAIWTRWFAYYNPNKWKTRSGCIQDRYIILGIVLICSSTAEGLYILYKI